MLEPQRGADRIELGLRFVEPDRRRSRAQPSEHLQGMRAALQTLRIERERKPDVEAAPPIGIVLAAHEVELARQYADDGKRRVVQRDRGADRRGTAAEGPLPERVTENHDTIAAGPVFVG